MKKIGFSVILAMALSWSAWGKSFTQDAIQPLPAATPATPASELGKKLFSEPRLSGHQQLMCKTCHQPDNAFSGPKTDGLNAPTLLNVVYNNSFFWNGRTNQLKEALREHIQAQNMMQQTAPGLESTLGADEEWVSAFNAVYQDGVTLDNVVDALESYLKTLTTPNSKFDQYLLGDQNALTTEEKEGFELFSQIGCVSCHQGLNIGGNIYQKMGIYQRYFKNPTPKDYGLYQFTGNKPDMFVFRVAPLRNIAITGPYLHDGSRSSLSATVETMAKYQLNQDILSSDIEKIVLFLNTLTGEQEFD